ncbi:MAG: hypothetical protein O2855_09135 [Planctomycetota bacterium]|nr:hypothetical protein [Planctomycetota bacterium]
MNQFRFAIAVALIALASLGGRCAQRESDQPTTTSTVKARDDTASAGAPTVASAPTTPPQDRSPTTRTWTVDGLERAAIVVPAVSVATTVAAADSAPTVTADASTPHPIVFVFHGHGGNARQVRRSYDIEEHWPEAMFVYPQGLRTPGRLTDPEGQRSGWQSTPGHMDDRDLHFYDAMLESLLGEGGDRARVYSTGHSNGGGFSYLLWSQRGHTLAAIAPSSAAAVRLGRDDNLGDPMPMMHIGATNDPLVKWEWQAATIDGAKVLNGCTGEGVPFPNGTTGGRGLIYRSETDTPVVTYISDGNHSFDRSSSPVIVEFFKKCRRAGREAPQPVALANQATAQPPT